MKKSFNGNNLLFVFDYQSS